MVALDISGSMETRDQGGRTRLEVAKEEVARFVAARPRDLLGLVTFGEDAVTRVPPTAHHAHLLAVLSELEVAREENGTALGTGLGLAVQRISGSPSPSLVVLLLTDGRNNTGAMEPLAVARAAGGLEVRVHAIGLGGPGGDDPVDEEVLREISSLSGGRFLRASDPRGFREVMAAVDALERGPIQVEATLVHRSYHQTPLLLGVCLLLLEALLWIAPGGRLR
jgi:Ca-activated chloride channel family protein